MKISLIITYYDPESRKLKMLFDLFKSIADNSVGHHYEIVLVHNGPSYVESVNQGLRRADGDYIVVLNDDVVIQDDMWLHKLCIPDVLSSWRLGSFHMDTDVLPDAACFAMSREVFKKLGCMDEQYKNGKCYEDTDYFLEAKKRGIAFHNAEVQLDHIGAVTTHAYFMEKLNPLREINREIFRNKWGKFD